MGTSKLIRFSDGIMEAVWLAAVILTPVFFNVYSSRIFEPDKIAFLRTLAMITLLAWIVKLIDQGRVRWDKVARERNVWQQLLQTPILPAVALMAISYLVSTIFSVSPQTSIWGSYQRLQGTYTFFSYLVIFFALIGNLRQRAQVDRLVTTIILTSLPVALYGVLQHYSLDPVPWGGNTSVRVASTLGNSIFVSAYLIMAIPLTLMRIVSSFTDILNKKEDLLFNVLRGTLYVFIFSLQIITIYFSGSRGPLLGLLAGLFLMVLLLSLVWGKRWLTYFIIFSALAGSIILIVFNIPDGPLQSLRESPAVGRFGSLLDTQSNTAKVRLYIWEGVVRMLSPHEPLQFPDGSQDALNIIRPLVGYGPEGMYVAYNPFYSAELGHVERRNASPDRSHNETWDSLVMTGFLGLLAYIFLFLMVFYYSFTWLKLIISKRQRWMFWGLAGLGGLIGSVAVLGWGGLPYLGVGLPFGVALGLLVYLAVVALVGNYEKPKSENEMAKAILLIALASAIMAHWLEINFGIAIVATRTYFWIYAGLLVVVGYVFPLHGMLTSASNDGDQTIQHEPGSVVSDRTNRSKRRSKTPNVMEQNLKVPMWVGQMLPAGFALGMVLVALCFDFITNASRAVRTGDILWNSFTHLANQEGGISYGILAMLLTSWIVGSLIWAAEIEYLRTPQDKFKGFLGIAAASFVFFIVYAWWHASGLSAIASSQVTTIDELLLQVERLGSLLTRLFFFVFLLILGYAGVASFSSSRHDRPMNVMALLTGLVGLIVVAFMTQFTNLQIIQADVAFKMADSFNTANQWPVATRLYQYSLEQAPSEDHYYLFLGRSYLEQAKEQSDSQQQTLLMSQAETDLKRAQRLNPLNTDHTANLARLSTWWASASQDPTEQVTRGETASEYYRLATILSPNNATLWGEWASLSMDILGDYKQAKELLDHALTIDPDYNFIYGLLGDYELQTGRNEINPELRKKHVLAAQEYFQHAVDISIGRDAATKLNYMLSLGNAHIELATLDPSAVDAIEINKAITIFKTVMDLKPSTVRLWQLNEQIGRLYLEINDFNQARLHIQAALTDAPEDQKSRLEELYKQANSQP